MKRKVLGILVVLVVSLTLVLLRADSEVHAAGLTRVQGPCSATSSGTSVFINLIRPALNDGLVAVITSGSYTSIKTVSSLSEDNVNWYLVVSSSAYDSYNDYVDVEIWAANVSTSSAGETVRASFSGSCEEGNTITVCEYSGLYPFVSSVTATNSGQGGTPDTGTTASTSAQLDVGALVGYANVFANPTNGFAMPAMLYTDTTYGHGAAYLERQLPQTGAVDCSVTSGNGNAPWAGAMATFSTLMPTFVSVATSSTSVLGSVVGVNGTLQDAYGNGLGNESVVLYYTFPGVSLWYPISSGTTDDLGDYYVQWLPPATGYFTIEAVWAGNETYSGASDTVTLSMLPYQNQYVFSVESNSTISTLAFNTTSQELSFTASGPSGTTGYAKVTIAKSLVSNITNIRVFLDNNQTDYSIASTDDSWLLMFNYTHSTHTVRVDLSTSTLPEFSNVLILFLLLILAAAVVVAERRKLAKLNGNRRQTRG